jgi:hypothetical protein
MGASGCATRAAKPEVAQSGVDSNRLARTYGWVGVAVGAEAAVVAAVSSGMMLHDKSVRDANCNAQKVCSPTGYDANLTLEHLSAWNAASWVLAVGGLGAGTYLLLSHPVANDTHVGIVVEAIGTGSGLGIEGAF